MSHSRLAPSSAHRWVHCHGSIAMSAQFPDTSGAAAADGEACHWVASETLQGRGADPFAGRTAPNGVIVTEEMVDAAKVYVGHVRGLASQGQTLLVEHKVSVPVHEECFGTLDCGWWQSRTELHIWDLKYGYGVVEPYENWQLICYALGLLSGVTGLDDQAITVNMHIVQPRPFHASGPVRTWRVKASDLRPHHNKLAYAAEKALQAGACTTTGAHCHYCPARHACPALQKSTMLAVDVVDGSVIQLLEPEHLALELRIMRRAADAIQYRLTGLEAQAKAIIQSGGAIPGWSLQSGTGRQTWCKPADEIFSIGDILGVNLRKSPDPITPAQARKAGIPDDVINAYTERGSSEAKLVPTTGTRIAHVFSNQQ